MEKFNKMINDYISNAIKISESKKVICNSQHDYECHWCSHNKPHDRCARTYKPESCCYGNAKSCYCEHVDLVKKSCENILKRLKE